ncbi:MAG: type II toxin-antitoxin system RelE/ParE family toxin [Alphaproteobacteria bacterium]
MIAKLHPIPMRFWRSTQGREPVREWLSNLPTDDKRVIGRDLATVQFGWPIGLPVCRPMGAGLWEVRSSLPSKREARLLFCFYDGEIFALHAFIKSTQETSVDDLKLATKRMKDVSV